MARATWLGGVTLAAMIAAGGADAADLTLKKVLLSTGGLGLYEYEADVEGDATVELKVPLDQVDDVLKSLVVFDDHGGVGGLDLASAEPLREAFRALPFREDDLQSAPRLLGALQGAEVEVGGPRAIAGRIVSIATEVETRSEGAAPPPRHRVTLLSDKGLEQFVLEQADSVKFSDPALREAVAKALQAVAFNHERESRNLRLISKGADKRRLRVAYLAAAPVWKTSYRLVLDPAPDAKTATLQGWATLENLSGQDWKDVDLTLVSGRPVAYKQALYRAYMVDRPEAPLDIGESLMPGVDRGDVALRPERKALRGDAIERGDQVAAAPSPALALPAPPSLSAGAEAIAAQESVTQVAFPIPFPVSLGAGRTLSLPIVDRQAPVRRVAIYEPTTDRRHPLSAAELTNDGASGLPPGIVTIYERGAAGASYVGDSELSATPAGEKRRLSFALDQKTTIEADASESAAFVRSRLVKGVLTIEELERSRHVFHVQADEPRRLIVSVPMEAGGRLSEPGGAAVTQADGVYRIPFEVKAADGQTFAATVEHSQIRAVEIGKLDEASLAVYVGSGEIDADTRGKLARLAELKAAHSDAERAVSASKVRIGDVIADQTRLKDLAGGAAVAGTDLQKRYLGKLDADETELEKLRADFARKDATLDRTRRAVEAFVAEI